MYKKIRFSPHPTEFYYISRLVHQSELPQEIDLKEYRKNNQLIEIFINPNVLSYSIIDNLLNMNFYFDKFNQIKLSFENFESLLDNKVFRSKLIGQTQILTNLHQWNIYDAKYKTENYRGGKRFIFNSKRLASQLHLELLNKLPKQVTKDLVEVNNIFRYNCFQPSDSKFKSHYDLPYVNQKRKIVSKYTLLIYLTEGENNPVLKIDELAINRMQNMTCLILSQNLEHQGHPYLQGNKIFIKTQLNYVMNATQFDKEAAHLFNTACYITKQAILDPQLEDYSNQCFKAHIERKLKLKTQKIKQFRYLHKRSDYFLNNSIVNHIEYITDGTNYYFPIHGNLQIYLITLLFDYFSGPGNTKIIDKYVITDQDQQKLFGQILYTPKDNECYTGLIPKFVRENKLVISNNQLPERIIKNDAPCPNHREFQMKNYIKDIYRGFYLYLTEQKRASFMMFDGQYTVNLDDIVITDDRIYFSETDSLKNFHFACSCNSADILNYSSHLLSYHPENMKQQIYNLPYINYRKTSELIIINIDVYHNGFVVESEPVRYKQTPQVSKLKYIFPKKKQV